MINARYGEVTSEVVETLKDIVGGDGVSTEEEESIREALRYS